MTTPSDQDPRPGSGHRLADRAILVVVSRAFASVSVVLLFIALARLLSEEAYGTFRQVWLLGKGATEVFALGVPASIFYFLPNLAPERKKLFVVQSLVLLAALAALCGGALYLGAGAIAHLFDNPALAPHLRVFALYPALILPGLAVQSVLVAVDRAKTFAVFFCTTRALFLVTAILVLLPGPNLHLLFAALVAFTAAELVASLWLLFRCTRDMPLTRGRVELGDQLRWSFPSGMANVVGILNQELDKLLIASFFTVAQFARFSNGAFEIPLIGTISGSVSSAMMPEYARLHSEGRTDAILALWHQAIGRVALVFLPMMCFLLFFAEPFIVLLFSSTYRESTPVFQVYLIAILPKVTWYGPLLMAMGRSREPLYGSLVALGSNALLSFLFIRWIGFLGPAFATVLTAYVLAAFFLARIRDATGASWSRVFPWGLVARTALASALPVLPLLALPRLGLRGELPLLVGAGLLYVPLLLISFRLAGTLGPEDRHYFRSLVLRATGRAG